MRTIGTVYVQCKKFIEKGNFFQNHVFKIEKWRCYIGCYKFTLLENIVRYAYFFILYQFKINLIKNYFSRNFFEISDVQNKPHGKFYCGNLPEGLKVKMSVLSYA